MSKRTKFAVLLLVALLLLALGVWFFIQPILKEKNAAQPPALPSQTTPYVPTSTAVGQTPAPQNAVQTPPPTPEQNQQLVIENKARATVERIGSGASGSGFLGYVDALVDMTKDGQQAALAEQKSMQQAHPALGQAYGITVMRNSASHLTKGAIGDAQVQVTVNVMQNVDAGDPSHPVESKRKNVVVTFAKQADGSYLVDGLAWSDATP
jgi:hypothetical protein